METENTEPSNRFSDEGVKFILDWASEVLKSKKCPESLVLNQSTTIFDCGYFLDAMIRTIRANYSNPLFRPTITQLYDFKEKLEQS